MNLLASRPGRLASFALLYLGEGLPQGFAAVATTLELKRLGASPEIMGGFSATIMAPWAWKWLMGPLVDNLHLERFGRRKQWILTAQVGMILTLFAALATFPRSLDAEGIPVGLGLFTGLLLCHNLFAACQDVGIDALATEVLPEDERGQANGLMFGAAQIGMAIGGSGVIALKGRVDFGYAALIVPAALSLIMGTVLAGLKEAPASGRASGVEGALKEIKDYGLTVLRAFFTTRRGLLAMILALLPAGAMSLSLTVSNVITPTLGMTDDEIAGLGAISSVIFALACVVGGYISDRWGRRRSLGLFAGAMVLPTLWMAWRFSEAGWQSAPEGQDGVWPRHEELITAWTAASYVYAVFMGLMYGVRSALYMDVADPRVAATQFTASMALLNLVTMYSYWWQGQALTPTQEGGWGFSLAQTMGMDAALGLVFLLILPFLAPLPRSEAPKS